MRRLLIGLGALALLALLWTLALGWWLPGFLLPRLQAAGSQALGEPVRLQALHIAPWSLKVRVEGLSIGPQEQPLLSVGHVEADASIQSVWRLAPVIERLDIAEPRLFLERQAPGRFNFSALLARLSEQPASEGEHQRFALHNIRVSDGSIVYADRVLDREHRVEALQLGMPFLSNLPSDVDVHVEPSLSATVDGSPLLLQASSLPFDAGLGSELTVRWRDIDLAHWGQALAPLLPPQARLELQSGRLALDLDVSFERQQAEGAVPRLQVRGQAALDGVSLRWPAGGVAARWDTLTVQGIDLQPLVRQAAVARVDMKALSLQLAEAEPTAAAAASPAPAATAPAAAGGDTAWQWSVGEVAIQGREVELASLTPARRLQSWQLALRQLASPADAPPADLTLEVAGEDGQGQLTLQGTVAVAARQARLAMEARQWPLAPWVAPWQAVLPVAVQAGTLDARANLEASLERLSVQGAEVDLLGVRLTPAEAGATPQAATPRPRRAQPAGEDHLAWAALRLRGGELALDLAGDAPPRMAFASAAIERLDAAARRLPDGRLPWLPAGAGAAGEGEATPATGNAGVAPVVQLADLRCTGCQVRFTDLGVTPAAELALARTELRLRHLSADLSQRVDFELRGEAQGGRVAVSGSARPQPLDLTARLDASGLDLRAVQPYIDPHVNLVLVSGKASARGELRLAQAGEGLPAVNWRGSAGLADLRTLDKLTNAEFARWKTLQLDGVDLAWRQDDFQADLGEIQLDDFYGRVILNADGQLNLRDVIRRDEDTGPRSLTEPRVEGDAPPASAPAPRGPATASATVPPAASGEPLRLRWQAIRLAGGRVDFSDLLIRPNYSARMTGLQGTVSAVAWNDPQPADVEFTGLVDGNAPLRIQGRFHPLGPRLYTDIQGEAKGIELTRLSPYAARYAGYAIEKGTLSMTVHYKLEEGRLDAQNQIFLDQLTFGEPVDSPDAIKAPVLLAVALLKNSRGEIDINLPVSGSLDDPQFSIGGIVVRLIVNLIVKAVTSPFALLASAIGAPDAELGHVAFAPGVAVLDEEIRRKLDALAQALADRPALKLEVTGRADPEADAEGLRQAHLRRLLRAAKVRATGESSADEAMSAEERERWLLAAYRAADLPDKPRNALGIPRRLPPEDMEKLLLASAPVGPEQLAQLANQRADRVKAYLVSKLAPERVMLTASRVGPPADDGKGTATGVEFSIK